MDKNKFKNRIFKDIFFISSIVLLVLFSFFAGIYIAGKSDYIRDASIRKIEYVGDVIINNKENEGGIEKDVDFKLFWDVWDSLKLQYVDREELSEKKMFYGAIHGMVASLGDPYTVFMEPKIAKEFEEDLAGTFEGIGAEIGIKNDILTIIAPLPGTPAEIAGLKAGDKILAIDDKDTTGIALDYAVSIIRGEKGTEVKLTVLSNGDTEPKEIKITRATIKIESVKFSRKDTAGKSEKDEGFSMKDGNIAYIELLYFNEDTLNEWNKTIQKVLAMNPKGIILDLRNNPGGFLGTAI